MTWKLNVDGIHDLTLTQNKGCVLGVLRSKTKNILSPGVKSMPTNVKFYIQRLDQSTQNFRILVTTNNLYFSCPAETGRYLHGWESSYTSHSIFVMSKAISRVFLRNNILFSMPAMVIDCTQLVPTAKRFWIFMWWKRCRIFFSPYIWYRTVILLQVFGNLYQWLLCIDFYCRSGQRNMYIFAFVI